MEECQGKGHHCLQRPGVGGWQGGMGAGRGWGGGWGADGQEAWGWTSVQLVVPASGPLNVCYAVSRALQEHSASLFLSLLAEQPMAVHTVTSPLRLRLSMLNAPLIPSTVGRLITIVSLLAPGKPSRTRHSGLVVLQTWPGSPSAGTLLSPSRLVLACLSVSRCVVSFWKEGSMQRERDLKTSYLHVNRVPSSLCLHTWPSQLRCEASAPLLTLCWWVSVAGSLCTLASHHLRVPKLRVLSPLSVREPC